MAAALAAAAVATAVGLRISGVLCDVRLITIVVRLVVRLGICLFRTVVFLHGLLNHADRYRFINIYQFYGISNSIRTLVLRYWI